MKRSEKIALGAVAVGIVLVSLFGVATAIARHRLSEAAARIKVPERIDQYRKAAPEQAGEAAAGNDRGNLNTYQQMFDRLETAYDDVAAYREYHELLSLHEDERPADYEDRIRQCVESMQGFIDAIRQVAGTGGPVQALDFSKGMKIELPHLAKLREVARLLAADADLAVSQGDVTRAVDDIVAAMQLGDALVDEPILISQLVRIAVHGIAFGAITDSLPQDLPRDQAQRLIEYMAGADHRDSFAECFAGEAALGEVELAHPEQLVQQHDNFMDYVFQNPPIFVLYNSPIGAPFMAMDAAECFDAYAEIQEISALPFYLAQPQIEELEQHIENLPRTRVLARTLVPSLARAGGAQARLEAILDISMLGLSIEQFYQDTGVYPEPIEDIGQTLPGGNPIDPFSGNPYIYHPSDTGFLLYSVGNNLVDDQGRFDWREGDIVWRGIEEED